MADDFNNHFFYPPPPSSISTLHSLPTILKLQAKRTLDTPMSRAATAAHVKTTLQNLCNQLQTELRYLKVTALYPFCQRVQYVLHLVVSSGRGQKYILIYKIDVTCRWQVQACLVFAVGASTDSEPGTGGDRDSSKQKGDMANREHSLKIEHTRPPGAPYGSDRGGTSSSQESGDHDAAMGNVLSPALTCQLRQPQIYKALGMDRPPISIPVFEADQWLESWHVIASSIPSQQAKLSESAPQSSISL